jgi:hypothetical protein
METQEGDFILFKKHFFVVLGVKPRALHTLNKHSTTELYPRA